jgi:DNA helicase-2/ATP-dependent DNA helicase PcrA
MTEADEEGPVSILTIAAAISLTKNGGTLKEVAQSHRLAPEALEMWQKAYRSRLRTMNALDLDDLQLLSVKLLQEHAAVRDQCSRAFDEILVDEYQDVNPVQRDLLTLLRPPGSALVAVGDEDQAIYGWRQADAGAVLRFTDDFPGATVIRVTQTYRSTKQILRAASSLIEHNHHRMGKTLRTSNPAGMRPICMATSDEQDEADWVAREMMRLVEREGRNWDEFSVLYRVGAQSRAIEDALLRHEIPYVVLSGPRFYERQEVRRVIAYLRLALDSSDDGALSYLLEHVRGIGPSRLQNLEVRARAAGVSLWDVISEPNDDLGLPPVVARRVSVLVTQVRRVQRVRRSSLVRVVEEAITSTEADAGDLGDASAVRENLDELRSVAREYGVRKQTLRSFVDRVTLGEHVPADESTVRLMTLHAAKGLESPVIFITGLEEGLLPHRRSMDTDASIEEERRLCYVGMTRARELLYLSYAHGRTLGGHVALGHPSRFIGEIGRTNMTLKVSETSRSRPRLHAVRPGERVMHARWSEGTVVTVEGEGRDTMVTILFDRFGRQRLQLCHAPLTRMERGTVDDLAG